MSQENVERARQIFDAVVRRDVSRLTDLTDPEVEWRSFFALLEGGEYRGHDGIRKYVNDISEAFEDLRPELIDLLDAGDVVIGVGQVHYRGRGSGVETEERAGWVFRFRDGRLLLFRAFTDPAEALENVGLSE